jgi:predicted dienelactone hydrolase
LIDVLLAGAVLFVAAWWAFASRRSRRLLRLAPVALAALAVLQLTVEGFYWQFLPGYLLVVVIVLLSIVRGREAASSGRWLTIAGQTGLVALMLAAIAPWTLLPPVPELTRPNGPYAVGTQIFRWVDESRDEATTSDPADKRNVIVQAWYPASRGAAGAHSTYIDGLGDLPDQVSLFPSFFMRSYGRIDTHGVLDAPVADNQPAWPVVVFSPGFGAPRAFYTGLATGLASKGYVVLAIDHPYEVAVTQLADGRIAKAVDDFAQHSGTEESGHAYMVGKINIRVADIGFTLDQIARPGVLGPLLSGHLDLEHIGAIGHSFGGAAAALAMSRDPRIKAAANIDGTLYGPVSATPGARPFLLLESDHAETEHGEVYEVGNRDFFKTFGGGYRYELKHANHFSFTDAPLFFAPPGRFALTLAIGGGRGPEETQRATVEILDAFLRHPLTGTPTSVEAAAAHYKDITGRPAL